MCASNKLVIGFFFFFFWQYEHSYYTVATHGFRRRARRSQLANRTVSAREVQEISKTI